MKILHFVDTAGSDETFVKAENFIKVRVEDATSVICHFQNAGELAPDQVDITVTSGKSDEVALRLAEYMTGTQPGGANVLTVKASTAPFTEISTVAWTDGA